MLPARLAPEMISTPGHRGAHKAPTRSPASLVGPPEPLGDLWMRTITVRLPAAEFSAAMGLMREWLDQNRCEPSKFKYDQEREAVVLSVEFPDDQQAEAFATRFNGTGRHPSSPTEI